MSYDDNNIFAKILRGEIPCKKIHEDDHVLSFDNVSWGKWCKNWRCNGRTK